MRRTIIENYILVVGKIWMPNAVCSMRYNLSPYDLENIGEFTRENVDAWLSTHAGDFSQVLDFYATRDDIEIPWASEDGECQYLDTISEED